MSNIIFLDEDLSECYDFYFYGIIYLIRNNLNNKIYIGKTKQFYKKYINNKIKQNPNMPIIKAIKKYGCENFSVKVIDVATTKEQLNNLEKFYIKSFNSKNHQIGYNICDGGEGGIGGPNFKGHKHTEETKEKMRNKPKSHFAHNKGRIFSEEWKKNMGIAASKALKGKSKSEEHKKNISLAKRGSVPSNKGKKLVIINGRKKYVQKISNHSVDIQY